VVKRAFPPVEEQTTLPQLPQTTAEVAWLKTVMLKRERDTVIKRRE
jgi:hypothetical protein